MMKLEREELGAWQGIAAAFLADKHASPSELQSCAIALKTWDIALSERCTREAARRMNGAWRSKITQP